MIASGLLAMMVVTVMVLFGQMLDSTTKNALMSQGTFFAETVVEQKIYALQENARLGVPPDLNALYSQDWISVSDDANRTQFLYRVEATPVDMDNNTDMGNSYAIQVEVRWWTEEINGEAKNRQGFGKMYLKRCRVVYVPAL